MTRQRQKPRIFGPENVPLFAKIPRQRPKNENLFYAFLPLPRHFRGLAERNARPEALGLEFR